MHDVAQIHGHRPRSVEDLRVRQQPQDVSRVPLRARALKHFRRIARHDGVVHVDRRRHATSAQAAAGEADGILIVEERAALVVELRVLAVLCNLQHDVVADGLACLDGLCDLLYGGFLLLSHLDRLLEEYEHLLVPADVVSAVAVAGEWLFLAVFAALVREAPFLALLLLKAELGELRVRV